MEEQKEEKKKRKKMALWLKLVIAFVSIAAVAVPVVMVVLPKSTPKPSVVDVSFSAYLVAGETEQELVRNEFAFDPDDINSTKKATGGVNKQIDGYSYIKLVYDFKNKSGETYLAKIDFYGVGNTNCKVLYQTNSQSETLLVGNEIFAQGNQDFQIEVSIKVDDLRYNSKFSGNILLSISAV